MPPFFGGGGGGGNLISGVDNEVGKFEKVWERVGKMLLRHDHAGALKKKP